MYKIHNVFIILGIILILLLYIIIYLNIILDNFIIIKNNFLEKNDFIELCQQLDDIKDEFTENNEKIYILLDRNNSKYDKIYNIIYNKYLSQIIKDHFNIIPPSKPSYDIEYRIYKKNKKSMGWHQDYNVIKKKYLECIFVIENNTNSFFRWFKHFKLNNYYQRENDLILLKPDDIIHNIDPILYGNKRILKFIIDLE